MVDPDFGSDFRNSVASRSVGILGHIENGMGDQQLITESDCFAEFFLGPCQNGDDVLIGRRGDLMASHVSTLATPLSGNLFRRFFSEGADMPNQFVIPLQFDSLALIEFVEPFLGQRFEEFQFRAFFGFLLFEEAQARPENFAGVVIASVLDLH